MEVQKKVPVPVYCDMDEDGFAREIYPMVKRGPAVLRGVGLGPCLEKWTVEYLIQIGGNRDVKVHVSTLPWMDFLGKNFVYR